MENPRRLGLIAVAAGLAAAIVAVAARRRSAAPEARDPTYHCTCGAAYRVSGVDRHRVYWLEGAADDAPVLGDRCVRCDAPLPAGHDTVVA